MRHLTAALLVAILGAKAAMAAPPRVVTDIAPVQSLVARVMVGNGQPDVLLPQGADAHSFTLRPSDAGKLENADILFWIGPQLTGWLPDIAEVLAEDARQVALIESPDLVLLLLRDDPLFDAHDHAEDDHLEDGEQVDPHIWLDPRNAAAMLRHIAEVLGEADPENAEIYATNAADGSEAFRALESEIAEMLEPVRDQPFVVAHDAYHYFESRFGLNAAGAIALSDATQPGAARVLQMETLFHNGSVNCIFVEPEQPGRLPAALAEMGNARLEVLDPLGAKLEPGPRLYPALMRDMAGSIHACLSAGD